MQKRASAVIAENPSLTQVALLSDALERSAFWTLIAARLTQSKVAADEFHILIKPDLNAFAIESPTFTDPALVEALIDLLHKNGYPRVDVCTARDSSFLWSENRDVAVLADLLGYHFVTPSGYSYEVLDLSEDLVPADFPVEGVLHGGELARTWRDAHFRICFAKNKTDEGDFYSLCLDSLISVLPLVDKDYYYRHRVPGGDAVSDLLRATPVHFAMIDATVSAHGSGGSRAPVAMSTHCIIASESAPLADYVGALKMSLDPYQSQLANRVFRSLGLPADYAVDGSLASYPGWRNVHPIVADSHRRREGSLTLSRLVKPWLQILDTEVFPLKHPIDATVNSNISPLFSDIDQNAVASWGLVTANYMLGSLNQVLEMYRTLYDKDALRQVHLPLGFQPEKYSEADYLSIVPELCALEPLLTDVPPAADGLRWRYVENSTVFEFVRDLPIDFEEFVRYVDVSKTIQHMNDYIGGVVVPVRQDPRGRVRFQAERNIYLPQPNYLALSQGKRIDVGKIEVCDYTDSCHRMFWKTIQSENDSAIYDDGIVSFIRSSEGTRVRIVGRQLFVLPPFFQAVNLDLTPQYKASLVTHAYKTFFDRTCSNLEALVEGREIRIGRSWRVPESPEDTEPLPVEAIHRVLVNVSEYVQGIIEGARISGEAVSNAAAMPAFIDDDGFKHFRPCIQPAPVSEKHPEHGEPPAMGTFVKQLSEFYSGLFRAIAQDSGTAGTGTRPS
jgi:uncharacterized protein (DUF362 family)